MHLTRLSLAALVASAASVYGFQVQLTIENRASSSPLGLYLTPVWLGAHDGTFDLFNPGSAASPAIEALAELGATSPLGSSFMSAYPAGLSLVANNPGGPAPGLFAPGSSRTLVLDLDPTAHRYLSFATMVVPSNDSFLANADPMGLQLFDSMGMFVGQRWTVTGAGVWDSGTEVNDPFGGAAFVAGVNAMLGTAENGVVHLQSLTGLDNLIGVGTPAGTTIERALGIEPLFSITASPVPEPSTYGLIGSAALMGVVWLRRRNAARAAAKDIL